MTLRHHGVVLLRANKNQGLISSFLSCGDMTGITDDYLGMMCAVANVVPVRYNEAKVGRKSRLSLCFGWVCFF